MHTAAALLAGAALALTAGTASAAPRSPSASCSASALVDFLGPLSGPAETVGKEQLNFARLAVSDYNARHGTKFGLVASDTRYDPGVAKEVAASVADNPAVLGVVGPAGSQEVETVGPVFADAGLAFVTPSATRVTLTARGRLPTFFRVVPNDDAQAPTVVALLAGLKIRKALVVDDREPYGKGLADSIQKLLAKKRIGVVRDSIDPGTTDFSKLIARVDAKTGAVVLPWQVARTAQLFVQLLRKAGWQPTVVGTDGLFAPQDFNPDGAYVTSFVPDIRGIPADAGLVRTYTARYGMFKTPYGPPAFLATQVLLSAITQACADGRAARDEVVGLLPQVTIDKSILGGSFSFGADHEPAGARFAIFRIVNGAYRVI